MDEEHEERPEDESESSSADEEAPRLQAGWGGPDPVWEPEKTAGWGSGEP
jgi:hypothetical protein